MADTNAAAGRALRTALVLFLLETVFAVTASHAHAYPPAGSEPVQVSATVSFTSRLGQETIHFQGAGTILRGDPLMSGGVEVVDLELIALSLNGMSITGPITITQSATLQSLGEIRSNQPGQDWPASAYLDIFVDVAAPASPDPTITKHNEDAIRVVPMYQGVPLSISSWPPSAVPWEAGITSCVSLLPTLPKDVCVTSLSLVLSATNSEEVGGLAELSRIGGNDAGSAWVARRVTLAASSVAAAALLCAAWVARRRFAG